MGRFSFRPPHSQEAKDKMSATRKAQWQDPVWREKQMLKRKEQKENGTYAKRGEAISKAKLEKSNGTSCIACGGYRVLLGYGYMVLEHRKVMEDYLERPLEPDEIPHHCDKNKLNNDIENLELVLESKHFSEYHPDMFKGRPSPMLGKHHTDEAKEKMRQASLGRIPGNKGKSPSEEARKRMSDGQKRRWEKYYEIHPKKISSFH